MVVGGGGWVMSDVNKERGRGMGDVNEVVEEKEKPGKGGFGDRVWGLNE